MIPLFALLYNRGQRKEKKYSILNIFPYFVLGFVGMIVFRNIGDQIFEFYNKISTILWGETMSEYYFKNNEFVIENYEISLKC